MITVLLIIFAASVIIFIGGKYADYKNSLGRKELNPSFQNDVGWFSPFKFIRFNAIIFVLLVGLGMLAFYLGFPLGLILPISFFIPMGIYGFILSKIK